MTKRTYGGHTCVCTLTGYTMCVEVDYHMTQFSLSSLWVLGIKLKSSVLVVSIFTHRVILLAQKLGCISVDSTKQNSMAIDRSAVCFPEIIIAS